MKKEGPEEILLREAMRGAEDLGVKTEVVNLSDVKFSFCDECLRCWDAKRCVTYEDVQRVLSKMTLADALIVATHISNLNVNSIAKSFFEICTNYTVATDAFKGKRGGALITCSEGEEKGFAAEALSALFDGCAIRLVEELTLEIGTEITERDKRRAFNLGAKVVKLPEVSLEKSTATVG
jgi:multimeric flavodoxin WrbA